MDNPQLSNGHTDLANELVDQFAKLHLSGNEWMILWVVIRRTYGWHKKEDKISLTQFQKASGLPRPTVQESLNKLVGKNLLVVNKDGYINSYSVNKVYSTWNSREKPTSRDFGTKIVGKSLPKLVGKSLHTKENKEIIQNNVRENADKIDYYAELIAKELNDSKSTDLYKHACQIFDPQRLLRKAKEIMKDGGAVNPGAVFTAWYMEQKKKIVVARTM